jgi:hypothetical protein
MFKAIFNGCICLHYKSYENFESYRIHSKELHAKRFLFTIWLIELVFCGLRICSPMCRSHMFKKYFTWITLHRLHKYMSKLEENNPQTHYPARNPDLEWSMLGTSQSFKTERNIMKTRRMQPNFPFLSLMHVWNPLLETCCNMHPLHAFGIMYACSMHATICLISEWKF